MDTAEVEECMRPIALTEGLRLVVLFGSAARGERQVRDLDLAVRADEPLDLVHLTNRVSPALAGPDVDLVDLRVADPVLLMSVAEEGVSIYESDPGEFVRFQSLAARRFFDTRKFREAEREEIADFIRRRRGAS